MASVGRVIGRDQIERAILQSLDDSIPIPGGSQGRIHLGVSAVSFDRFIGKGEVMRAGLGGDLDSTLFAGADQIDRAGSADMLDVDSSFGLLRKDQIARDHNLLGGG